MEIDGDILRLMLIKYNIFEIFCKFIVAKFYIAIFVGLRHPKDTYLKAVILTLLIQVTNVPYKPKLADITC